jgi:hypothetical protein
MSGSHALTVRLDDEDYSRLEREAERLGMRPGTLARVLLRAGIRKSDTTTAPEHGSPAWALTRLAEIRSGLPQVDAASLVREGRAELHERFAP